MDAATIDPAAILAKLPNELKLVIQTFAFIFQMQDAFLTNDLDEIARLACANHTLRQVGKSTVACWLTALVSGLNF